MVLQDAFVRTLNKRDIRLMRIFVDCDDTLLLYHTKEQKTPYGMWTGIPFTPNYRLIGALMIHKKDHSEDEIIFWSGGAEYAKECATKLHLWDMAYAFAHKNKSNFHMVQEGDIVIDDDSFSDLPKEEQIRTHTPFNWPEEEWKGRPDKEIIKHVT